MRSVVILATILAFVGSIQEAFAQKPIDCIEIAAAFANAGQREIEGWLKRYHASYNSCVAKKDPATGKLVSTKKVPTIHVPKPSKANRVHKKNIPQSASDTNSKMLRIPKVHDVIDPALASWTKNCTQRYGSFSKDSEFYSTSSGRRSPCSMFLNSGTLSLEKFLAE